MTATEPFGLSAALCLPLARHGAADEEALVAHARRCLGSGCDSVTLFGTTGEGASVGTAERAHLLGRLDDAGLALPRQVLGGVTTSAVEDAASQASELLRAGCRGVLLAPPFYYKGVDEEGVYAWYAGVFERLGTHARDVILYDIPALTGVALSVELVGRLREHFPDVVQGVKDSSGDFPRTRALLDAHAADLSILVGDERSLAEGVRLGAEGAISGMANVCPGVVRDVVTSGREDERLTALVDAVLAHPVVPAVKALLAHRLAEESWRAVRAPLVPLDTAAATAIGRRHDELFGESA